MSASKTPFKVEIGLLDLDSLEKPVPSTVVDRAFHDIHWQQTTRKKEEGYIDHLNDEGGHPLAYLSVLLAVKFQRSLSSAPHNGKRSEGNVCVALCTLPDNAEELFCATNVEDCGFGAYQVTGQLADFADPFDLTLDGKRREFEGSDMKLEFRKIATHCCLNEDDFVSEMTRRITVKRVHKRLRRGFPAEPEGLKDMKDPVLKDLCTLLHHWRRIAVDTEASKAVAVIELAHIYLSSSPKAGPSACAEFIASAMQTVYAYKAAMYCLLYFSHLYTGQNKHSKVQSMRHAVERAEPLLCTAGSDILVSPAFLLVKKSIDGLEALKARKKLILVQVRHPADLGGQVAHCEVKLYHYLRQEYKLIPLKGIPIHISKALCMDCAVFFFSCVASEQRPAFTAVATDHFPNVYCSFGCEHVDSISRECRGVSSKVTHFCMYVKRGRSDLCRLLTSALLTSNLSVSQGKEEARQAETRYQFGVGLTWHFATFLTMVVLCHIFWNRRQKR
jgi:hypothetical protein